MVCRGICGRTIVKGERVIYFGEGKYIGDNRIEKYQEKVMCFSCFGIKKELVDQENQEVKN